MLRKLLDIFPVYVVAVENDYRFVVLYTSRFHFKAERKLRKIKDSGMSDVKLIKL